MIEISALKFSDIFVNLFTGDDSAQLGKEPSAAGDQLNQVQQFTLILFYLHDTILESSIIFSRSNLKLLEKKTIKNVKFETKTKHFCHITSFI